MMESILEILFYIWENEKNYKESINKLEIEIENDRKRLKENLNKKQREILLRIIDTKNIIKEESDLENFTEGFKLGLKIGYESNKN